MPSRQSSQSPHQQTQDSVQAAPAQPEEQAPKRSEKTHRNTFFRRHPAFTVVLVFALLLALFFACFSIFREKSEDWLSEKDALQIALKDAGTKDGLVYDVSVRLYMDDPITYVVSFRDYTGSYYYELDAHTGVILAESKTPA